MMLTRHAMHLLFLSFQNEHSREEDKITISDIRLPVLKGDVKVMFFSTNKVAIR